MKPGQKGTKYSNPMVNGGAPGDTAMTMPGARPMQPGCWDKVARMFQNTFGCALPCYRGGFAGGGGGGPSAPLISGMRPDRVVSERDTAVPCPPAAIAAKDGRLCLHSCCQLLTKTDAFRLACCRRSRRS